MDAMGHVNNAVYFRYIEIIRIEWLHSIGGGPNPDGEGPVIANTFCNFIRQLEFPGDVRAPPRGAANRIGNEGEGIPNDSEMSRPNCIARPELTSIQSTTR